MRVTHTLQFACRCPVDDRQDVYECVVESDRVLKVEDIWAAVRRATERPEFQETITDRLAEDLGCKVTTIGLHSNVRTVATCGEAKDAYERGRR
jgi:GTP cyclohydrolase I